MKKVVVLSLGGSLIIPDQVNLSFLKKFKEPDVLLFDLKDMEKFLRNK